MSADPTLGPASKHLNRCARIMEQSDLVSQLCMILVKEIILDSWNTHRQRGQDLLLQNAAVLKELCGTFPEPGQYILREPNIGQASSARIAA